MTVNKNNQHYQITLTPEEKQQLKALCQVTKEQLNIGASVDCYREKT